MYNFIFYHPIVTPERLASLPSLTLSNYNYKIYVSNPPSAKDLHDQVDHFFKQLVLEKHVIIEPIQINQYVISFPSLVSICIYHDIIN